MSFNKTATYPPNPQATRGRASKLSADGSGEKVVYVNDKTVVIRELGNVSASQTYTQHISPVSVARLSPSGFYCASADASGTVRVWDVAGSDQVLKYEAKGALGGKVNDIAWDSESKRIIVVGEGRESFGRAFMADSGSSCGEISGHSKAINAVSIRSKRPFRAVTASDDGTIVLSNGVPFKFSKTIKSHSSFVNDVAYSPDGDVFASCGADGKVFLYEGSEGEIKGELTGGKSTSSLYSLAFSPDSQTLATSSAASIVTLYSVGSMQPTLTFDLSKLTPCPTPSLTAQLGLTFLTPSTLASLSLSGVVNILDARAPDQVSTLHGPSKGITALGSSSASGGEKTLWAGSFDGGLKSFEGGGREWKDVVGSGHKGQIVGIEEGGKNGGVLTTAWDDCVREVSSEGQFSALTIPTSSQPTSLASSAKSGLVAVAAGETIDVISSINGKKVGSRSFQGEKVLSVALVEGSAGINIAVGLESKQIHLFSNLSSSASDFSSASPSATFLENKAPIYALAFSPDAELLTAGDGSGKIQVYSVSEQKIKISNRWSSHTGRITSLRFSPDSALCASSSLDSNVFVWSVAKPLRSIKVANAHAGGATGVEWVDGNKVASSGADACVRVWQITPHA